MGGVAMSVVLPNDEELESLEGRDLDERARPVGSDPAPGAIRDSTIREEHTIAWRSNG